MSRLLKNIYLISFFLFFCPVFADETLTITTYYPSPYGVYRELRSQRMAIGDTYIDGGAYCWEGTCTNIIGPNADLVVEGNVGIGTTAPNYPLQVTINGSGEAVRIQNSAEGINYAGLYIAPPSWSPGRPAWIRSYNNNGLELFTSTTAGTANNPRVSLASSDCIRLLFSTTNTNDPTDANWSEKVRITKDGNVGIGTVPTFQLQLSTDSAAKPGTTTWTVASDRRVKKDIRPYTNGLKIIKNINPVWFKYNGKAGLPNDNQEHIGVIGQEIAKVASYTVNTFKAKLNPEDKEETELLNFNPHALVFDLINSVKELDSNIIKFSQENQELKKDNKELKSALENLQTRLSRLEARLKTIGPFSF